MARKRRALGGGLGGLNVVTDSRRVARPRRVRGQVDPTMPGGQRVLYGRTLDEIAGVIPPTSPATLAVEEDVRRGFESYWAGMERGQRAHRARTGELTAILRQGTAGIRAESARTRADIEGMKRAEMEEWGGVVSRLGGRGISRADLIGMGPPGFTEWMQGPEAEKFLPMAELLRRRRPSPPVQAGDIIESMIRSGTPGTRAEITRRVMERRPAARGQREADITGAPAWERGGLLAGDISQTLYPTTRREDQARLARAQTRLEGELTRVDAELERAKGRGVSDEDISAIMRRRAGVVTSLGDVRHELGQYPREPIITAEGVVAPVAKDEADYFASRAPF